VWLAVTRGRRVSAAAVAGALVGLVALGGWSYVLNDVHSGAFLGAGTSALEDRGSPSYPGSVKNAFLLMYGTMDLSVLSNRLIDALGVAGLVLALAIVIATRKLPRAAAVALPFAAPLLVVGGAGTLAFVARRWGFPLRGPDGVITTFDQVLNAQYTRISNEDWNAFGPLGIVALVGACAFSIGAYVARRVDVRHAALATALPISLVLMALETTWNPFLVRFFLVPAAVSAPLLAVLFRDRLTTAAYLVVGVLAAALTIVHVQSKPLGGHEGLGRPWQLTQSTALFTNSRPEYAKAVSAYDALVPPHACVGAVFNDFDPSYLLYRPRLRHRVVYLSPDSTLVDAVRNGLFYVVLTSGEHATAESQLRAAGWQIRPLGDVWELASAPHAGAGTC
jgi:hypothetical protein